MKKHTSKSVNPGVDITAIPQMRVSYLIILIAYCLFTVVTPRLGALDSNAPKFLSLALLNVFSFLFLLTHKKRLEYPEIQLTFFRNKIGIVYTLFIAITLITFSKAINIPESIVSFSKYFTVFFSTIIISILLGTDKRYFRVLIIIMVWVLLIDCITVLFNVFLYLSDLLTGMSEIKSVYSNKNMLTSAIFLKIPFALWIFTFEKGRLKIFGLIVLFLSFLSIFYLSTRAFYVGLAVLSAIYLVFLIIYNHRYKTLAKNIMPAILSGVIILALVVSLFTQKFLYPQKHDAHGNTVFQRVASISYEEASAKARIDSWKRSFLLIEQNPILGVGTGNWKIRVLQYENPEKSDFVFMGKNHNDFIEIAAECGILGFIMYFFIFIFLIFNFLRAFLKQGEYESSFMYLFISAFGVFCYSVDAFFNFPADRPEIQSLFALFIGSGIAYSHTWPNTVNMKSIILKPLYLLTFGILLIAVYILVLNYNSLKLQQLEWEDSQKGKLSHNSNIFITGFPIIPNISTRGLAPIAVDKSIYLIEDGKYLDAINLLRKDNASPFDSRREFYMAEAFSKMGLIDSALLYAYKAHALKPLHYNPVGFICDNLNKSGHKTEAALMMEAYVLRVKNNADAWLGLTTIYQSTSNFVKAIETIDSAAKYLPGNMIIKQKQNELSRYKKIVPYQRTYSTAMGYYNQQNFLNALKYFNEIIHAENGAVVVFARRAVCYFNLKEYQKCINDLNISFEGGYNTPDLVNIRGACFISLKLNYAACRDFEDAAARGDINAANNKQRFCK